MSLDNPDMHRIAPYDWMLTIPYLQECTGLWAGLEIPPSKSFFSSSDPSSISIPADILANPTMNPVAADLRKTLVSNGVKLVIVSGTWDLLHPDIVEFVQKAEDAGVQLTYIEGEHQFHCFVIAVGVTPEVKEGAEMTVRQIVANGERL